LQNSLGRHVSSATCLLALSNNSLEDVDNLLVELSYRHMVLLLGLAFAVSLLFKYVLQAPNIIIILKKFLWQSRHYNF